MVLVSSCATQQNILYLQDKVINEEVQVIGDGEIRFKPGDQLSIFVSCSNSELSVIFNLARIQNSATSGSVSGTTSQSGSLVYTVDNSGNIDFPVLGAVSVGGMTKNEVAEKIKSGILRSGMITDPIVTVDYQNLMFSTLGEVSRPGTYAIVKGKTTIMDALSMSGDLTINGLRDKVFVTRQVDGGGKLITYQLDLRSSNIYQSPAYYIQQNDLIYVEPNNTKANQSTVNGNNVLSTSFWLSVASLITTITVLVVK